MTTKGLMLTPSTFRPRPSLSFKPLVEPFGGVVCESPQLTVFCFINRR